MKHAKALDEYVSLSSERDYCLKKILAYQHKVILIEEKLKELRKEI